MSGEPVANIKGSFKGTRAGVSATFNGTGTGPIEVVDVGGGTNGIAATGSYKSNVGGVPFSEKNLPLMVAAPPGAVDNLQQDWNVQRDIASQGVKGKQVIMASAQLVLPNGDTIMYPERKAKYSETKGYKLSFKKGTNITASPSRIDKRSSLAINGLTFDSQGTDWVPSGGTIKYQFLGQKGTANLLDFVMP